MKTLLPSILPALALLTLGGCAGTSALSTTENDGVYYSSSKDRITSSAPAVASTAPATTSESQDTGSASGDVENPDYTGPSNARASANSEYYDEDYYYASRLRRFHQAPYRGMGLGYYDFAYTDPFWYGGPVYSPYSAWGPGAFYDPFYSPWYGGSFVNINIAFGRPWYRPWGYGYGYSPYDYYGGYGYGRPWGNYYGGGFGGHYGGFYGRNFSRPQRSVVTGTRSRLVEGNATGGATGNNPRTVVGSRSRNGAAEGGLVSPNGSPTSNANATTPPSPTGGRGRSREVLSGVTQPNTTPATPQSQVAESTPANQPASGGRRWRVLSENTSGAATEAGAEPTTTRPRRSWNSENAGSQSSGGGENGTQPRRERAAQQPTRTYSEPSSEPTRTYSQPSRTYSEPSYSAPSRSSDGGGGGGRSSGGGGGGGRGRGN